MTLSEALGLEPCKSLKMSCPRLENTALFFDWFKKETKETKDNIYTGSSSPFVFSFFIIELQSCAKVYEHLAYFN